MKIGSPEAVKKFLLDSLEVAGKWNVYEEIVCEKESIELGQIAWVCNYGKSRLITYASKTRLSYSKSIENTLGIASMLARQST